MIPQQTSRITAGPHFERAATPSPEMPRLGGWQLVRRLSMGERTAVYQARPLGSPTCQAANYALKVAHHPQRDEILTIRSLCREAFLGQKLCCPNLVPVMSANLSQTPQFIVMPLLAGASLSTVLASGSKPSLPVALWIARQIATALDVLHTTGWMHGDVKPANVVIAPSGHATLIDLGFARRFNEPADNEAFGSFLCGTPSYMAPECFTSRTQIDARSDLYSLGVMLYELLSGKVPFGTSSAERLIQSQLTEKPQELRITLPSIPTRVSRLVQSLLAKAPERRVATARELADRLASLEIESFGERSAIT